MTLIEEFELRLSGEACGLDVEFLHKVLDELKRLERYNEFLKDELKDVSFGKHIEEMRRDADKK